MKTTFSISISIPKMNSQSTWPFPLHFFGINFTISKYRFTIIFKVACVVKTKLFLHGLILIWFDNTNEVMQNNIQKFRKSFIAFEKPSILSENFENFELELSYHSIFFAETLHTFSTYQCLQKRLRDFF